MNSGGPHAFCPASADVLEVAPQNQDCSKCFFTCWLCRVDQCLSRDLSIFFWNIKEYMYISSLGFEALSLPLAMTCAAK